MISTFVLRGGRAECTENIDPAWIGQDGVVLWVDMVKPTPEDANVLRQLFGIHELAVEDAMSEIHHPKIESYDGTLYLILHGIDFQGSRHRFATRDIDFFLGKNFLVTVHDGKSRSIEAMRNACTRGGSHALREGPDALLHRIIDQMVDHYWPEVEQLRGKLDAVENDVFARPHPQLVRRILDLKRDVASLRRVMLPQRDAIARLARREFSTISDSVAYRFRDVHDHLVRVTDEALWFQDRITTLLEAHLTNVSNQLNTVMKVLTVIATIFMPLTVLTSLYGMNVELPHLPGGVRAQFWWIVVMMLAISGVMLWWFRKNRWI